MSYVERLNEAIDDLASNYDVFAAEMGEERATTLLHAARAYRDLLANGQRVEAKTLLQSGWFVQVPESGEYIVVPALSVYPKEADE